MDMFPTGPGLGMISVERRFQLFIDAVRDYAIYMLDPEGIVSSWNSGARRFKGYQASEIIGQHFSRFYTEDDRQAGVPQQALAIAEREGKFEAEGWRVRKDGSRFWASVVIDPIRDENGNLFGFAKVTRDITERREAQKALEEAREALFQSQKMEALGQLTGGFVHDFNNMLQIIASSLGMIERRVDSNRNDLGKYITHARTAISMATALTQRLLAFARCQPLVPKRTDLNALILGMQSLIHNTVGHGIAVEMNLAQDLHPILIDSHQMESALLNLALNSRDAMPQGGCIVIKTANVHMGKDFTASNPGLIPGDYVMLCVTDTGSGMPPDVLARAFEPFFTTKPIGQGTGLGLSQIYGFMRQSNGYARIESVVDHGTSVKLYLPRDQENGTPQSG